MYLIKKVYEVVVENFFINEIYVITVSAAW